MRAKAAFAVEVMLIELRGSLSPSAFGNIDLASMVKHHNRAMNLPSSVVLLSSALFAVTGLRYIIAPGLMLSP